MDRKFITIVAFAARFGVTRRTVDKWLADPRVGLPAPLRIANRMYFDLEKIAEWEADRVIASGKAA